MPIDKSGSTRERVVEQKAKTANSSSQRRGSSQTGSSSSTGSTNWQAIISKCLRGGDPRLAF